MIALKPYKLFLDAMVASVNDTIDSENSQSTDLICPLIGVAITTVSEAHAIKKLKDTAGVVLIAKLADADTKTDGTTDNYSELNHQLLYVIRKTSASELTEAKETEEYAILQRITQLVKQYIMDRKVCDTRMDKPFHTEWEYNVFGGYNGLSISFDLKDYSL
jgi:hypothetical protein